MELDIKTYLTNSSLFAQLDAATLADVLDVIECQRLYRGQTLFRQGDVGDAFYLLASGRLTIIKDTVVGELLPGESFGELALISDQPRAATIVAARDCELARLPKQQFQQILQRHPSIAVELLKLLSQRLNHQQQDITQKVAKVITLVVKSAHPAVTNLPASLTQTLSNMGKTLHLDAAKLDQQLKPGAAEIFGRDTQMPDEQLGRLLSIQEQQCDYIVLETPAESSTWRNFCLSQADKVLYLVHGDDKPETLSVKLRSYVDTDASRELVLVHSDTTNKPCFTVNWLKLFDAQNHHHIRQNNPADTQRLARNVADQSIALVLGGGGARSFAHIGVIKAMEELGIKIDRIAGTSMGAIIGAQYADGHNPKQLQAINEEIWVHNKPHHDVTLPVTSLLSAGRAKEQTCKVFAQRHIEDLWLDYFCISTDLTQLKPCRHESGAIWSALLASGAIPGICSSIVSDEGSLLVDGGLIDNLPVAAMRERHRGPIIAVDVSSDKGLRPNTTSTIPPNGWRALWSYLNPWAKQRPFPHIFKLITHTATLASKINAESSRQLADLCLTPKCEGHKLMEMKNLDKLIEQGYLEAKPKLEQWLATAKHNRPDVMI